MACTFLACAFTGLRLFADGFQRLYAGIQVCLDLFSKSNPMDTRPCLGLSAHDAYPFEGASCLCRCLAYHGNLLPLLVILTRQIFDNAPLHSDLLPILGDLALQRDDPDQQAGEYEGGS